MRKIVVVALMLFTSVVVAHAQNAKQVNASDEAKAVKNDVHKIVFQITTEDTLAHRSLMKNLNNVLTLAPDAKLEVVCHGPGLSMLVTAKTMVQDKIAQLKKRGVEFVACEFSMRERNVTKDQMIPEAGFVKGGILEVVMKQEEGWSYIKSGF